MITFNNATVYGAAWRVCREIFTVACREYYDSELNHAYSKEYRQHALEICHNAASSSYVKKFYNPSLHDRYSVEVPNDVIDDLLKQAVYKNGNIAFGSIEFSLQ